MTIHALDEVSRSAEGSNHLAEALRGALKAPGVAGTGRHLLAEAARILPDLRDMFDLLMRM